MLPRLTTSRFNWIARLRLLPRSVLLTLAAVLLATLASLMLSEITVRAAQQDTSRIAGVLQRIEATSDVKELDKISAEELAELRRRQVSSVFRARLAMFLSTLLIIGLLFTVVRLFIQQAARQQLQKQTADREARRMHELVAARTVELSELSSHLQTVVEREKAELARNLHDELGGLLTAAKMDLAWLHGAINTVDPEITRKLDVLSEELSEAMDVKRRVVESLRPALLDHFGLPASMENYFDDTCRKAGLNCEMSIADDLDDLPQDVTIALFRIGQESLTNILRHARAKNVKMFIGVVDDNIQLSISDDGIGIKLVGRKFRGSHGINGMRHRVESLGGTFSIESEMGHGTRVDIRIPRTKQPRR